MIFELINGSFPNVGFTQPQKDIIKHLEGIISGFPGTPGTMGTTDSSGRYTGIEGTLSTSTEGLRSYTQRISPTHYATVNSPIPNTSSLVMKSDKPTFEAIMEGHLGDIILFIFEACSLSTMRKQPKEKSICDKVTGVGCAVMGGRSRRYRQSRRSTNSKRRNRNRKTKGKRK